MSVQSLLTLTVSGYEIELAKNGKFYRVSMSEPSGALNVFPKLTYAKAKTKLGGCIMYAARQDDGPEDESAQE